MNISKMTQIMLPLALLLSGCAPVQRLAVEVTTDEHAPVRLGVLPSDSEANLRRKYQPVTAYLSAGLSRPVELVIATTYDSVGELLDQGKVELAWLSGVSFLREQRRHRLAPLAAVSRRGKTTYHGVIVARAGSGIHSLADLKGKRFAYVDRDSGSGFLAPNRMFAAAGLDPLHDLAQVRFTYSHGESIRCVRAGEVDAAAVHEGAAEPGLEVIATSGPLEPDIVVAAGQAPPELRDRAARLFLEMTKTPEGKKTLEALHPFDPVDGFVAVPAELAKAPADVSPR